MTTKSEAEANVLQEWWACLRPWAAERWARLLLLVIACVGIGVLAWQLRDDVAKSVHNIPGRSIGSGLSLGPDVAVDMWIGIDVVFMLLVACALLLALSLPRPDARIGSLTATAEQRWLLVGVVATIAYLVSDFLETMLLWVVATRLTEGSSSGEWLLKAMGWAHNAKWMALAVALIAVAARWGRRTPRLPGTPPAAPPVDGTAASVDADDAPTTQTVRQEKEHSTVGLKADWNDADHVPMAQQKYAAPTPDVVRSTADDWIPSNDRFGVAVSGGGIRSASFALGVFDELRHRDLLKKARYVTAVSGGCYAASALEQANRVGVGTNTELIPRLRRRLNYLLPDTRRSFAGILRVLLGLFLNLWILYLVIFMVARPVGWAIGTPFVQEGLRYDGAVVTDVISDENDPDLPDDTKERWSRASGCGLGDTPPDTAPTLSQVRRDVSSDADKRVTSIEFKVHFTTQCVAVDHASNADRAVTFMVLPQPANEQDDATDTTSEPEAVEDEENAEEAGVTGLIRIENGVAEIVRQPQVAVGAASDSSIDMSKLVDLSIADIELTEKAQVATADVPLDELLDDIEPVVVVPKSIVDLRGDLDWDKRHAVVPGSLAILLVFAWAACGHDGVVARPRRLRRCRAVAQALGWGFLLSMTLLVVMPWLVKVVPDQVADGLVAGPTEEQTGGFSWLPSGLQPVLAWPVLAIATVVRFFQQQRSVAKPAGGTPKKRNAVAFLNKIVGVLTRLVVGLVLLTLVLATSIMMMTTAALNGPFGSNAWISRELFGWRIPWPPDLAVWAGVIVILLITRTAFAAGTWSLGPHYRRQLRWAFMRDANGYDAFDGSALANPQQAGDGDRARAGFLEGTRAELVVCGAANVLGPDRAPAGRRAVSFSASRSWIGGPELGWVDTSEYIAKLSPARRTDVTVSAMTAISGAAASPAMGKQSLGPLGSVLAVLNVRLGGWLPHPAAVSGMPSAPATLDAADASDDPPSYDDGPTMWRHTPGWPYFVREVIRRHKQEAAYVYVSDGGHWENLGLVESIRRGCNTIIVISAAGDGASSHATLAEAVEIARTDLDVEIDFDDVWRMRPTTGGDPASTLPSGRQFLRQRGDEPELGRVAPQGWTFGTFTRNGIPEPHNKGHILLIEATMVDDLAVDVHAYAEGHHEFPDINTGDQFFTNRDFESYRMLGSTLAKQALDLAPTPQNPWEPVPYTGVDMEAAINAMP